MRCAHACHVGTVVCHLKGHDAAGAAEGFLHCSILHDLRLQDGQPRRPLHCVRARLDRGGRPRRDWRLLRLRLSDGVAGPRSVRALGGHVAAGVASVLLGLPWTLPLDRLLAGAAAAHSQAALEMGNCIVSCSLSS